MKLLAYALLFGVAMGGAIFPDQSRLVCIGGAWFTGLLFGCEVLSWQQRRAVLNRFDFDYQRYSERELMDRR